MKFFDAHSDTLYEAATRNLSLYENDLHIDFKRLKSLGCYTQFFAAWIKDDDIELFTKMAEKFNEETKKSDIASACRCLEDMENAHKSGKIAAFLTLEGAGFIKSPFDVEYLKLCGVKAASLTWNFENSLAGGVDSDKGLTALGKAVIEKMQSEGIIVDVSHLNEKSFWDFYDISNKPFIASHSNAKAICNHKRNLTDKQIKAISNSGGCIGINFYPKFLKEDGRAGIEEIVKHIKYIVNVAGENSVGIGTDFDGIGELPDGIFDVSDMIKLKEMIISAFGYSQAEKILYKNFERVLTD